MNRHRRLLFLFALAGAALLAACGKPEPPPAPKVEAPKPAAPAIDAELQRAAAEVYVFALPLVLTDVTREAESASHPPNEFVHQRGIPDATTAGVAYPNADFLYSRGWLDLSEEPVILSAPDTRGRYYLVAMLDGWTNVAASLGKRTTGAEKADFAIIGPDWKGKLPGGLYEVRSPTQLAWLFGRTEIQGRNDEKAATRIQDQFKLTPLSSWGKRSAKAARGRAAPPGGSSAPTDPRERVATMDATAFFTRFAALLPGNPPAADDAPMLEKIKRVGIIAGQPFGLDKLDALAARSVEQGVKIGRDEVIAAAGRGAGGEIKLGWTIDRTLGRWGTYYGKRAVLAWIGLGVNAPEDAIFMSASLDGKGHRLDGANRYVLHFDKDATPPTEGFWSLSLYDDKRRFVANAINRHNIGSEDRLRVNADGSLDIHIQHRSPGKDKEPNWLPAPQGSFSVILRIYWPGAAVLDGSWTPPGLQRIE